MLYSVRMRAAENGDHGEGGRHISGAESIVPEEELGRTAEAMINRALRHAKGQADFINITVEAVNSGDIAMAALLPVTAAKEVSVEEGRQAAVRSLVQAGVAEPAAVRGLSLLVSLTESMRGAVLVCSETGNRLDSSGTRGIRVSRMAAADENAFAAALLRKGLSGSHVKEALILASKVAAAPGIVAELCWSDDPDYTAGYVASSVAGYVRFPRLKPLGLPLGGRVFFINRYSVLAELVKYLEKQPVLIEIPDGWSGEGSV